MVPLWKKIKAKNIYKIIAANNNITAHLNSLWYSNLDDNIWKKHLDRLWKSTIEPKIKCFKWLLLLDRLPN